MRDTRLEPAARHQRGLGVRLIYTFLREAGFQDIDQLTCDKERCAGHLDEWVQYCYDSGSVAVGLCRNGLLGFVDKRWQLKGHIGLAWQSLRSWEEGEPLELRKPWPIGLFLAALSVALAWEWWATATQLWLQFHAMLRPAEGCSLLWADIVLAEDLGDPSHGAAGVVRIRNPKTHRWGGRQQMVLLTDPWLIWWLRNLKASFEPAAGQPLFPFTTATFNMRISRILTQLNMPSKSFTAAGLRAGGTTHLMRLGVQIEWLRHRGRWKSSHSMERYLQECGAVLAEIALSHETKVSINKYADLALAGVAQSAEMLAARASLGKRAYGLVSPFAKPAWTSRKSRQQQQFG